MTFSAEAQQDRRLAMVNGQLRTGDVVDQEVLAAFLDTPRERFVAPACAPLAYLDRETPALGAKTRRLLRPLTLARMIQAAGSEVPATGLSTSAAARDTARQCSPPWAPKSSRSNRIRGPRPRRARSFRTGRM